MWPKSRGKGPGPHPWYGQLKNARPGFLGLKPVKWNFTKFLIARNGEVLARYGPRQVPRSFDEPVEKALSHPVPGCTIAPPLDLGGLVGWICPMRIKSQVRRVLAVPGSVSCDIRIGQLVLNADSTETVIPRTTIRSGCIPGGLWSR